MLATLGLSALPGPEASLSTGFVSEPPVRTFVARMRSPLTADFQQRCAVRKAELGPVDLATAGPDPTHGPTAPKNACCVHMLAERRSAQLHS